MELNNTLKVLFVSGNLHCAKCRELLIRKHKANYPAVHTCIDRRTYYVTWPKPKNKPEPGIEPEITRGLVIYKKGGV